MIVGRCYICGKTATHICKICGKPVCDEHYIPFAGTCTACGKMQGKRL